MRPLLVVENNKLTLSDHDFQELNEGQLTVDDLWKHGVIDYIDPMEHRETLIAQTLDLLSKDGVQYCEIEGIVAYGLPAASIPVFNCNDPIRNIGSCKMQKQAFGAPVQSEFVHHRGTYITLRTPERPMVISSALNVIPNCELLYSGQTALTAIMPVMGFNQEDGLVMSKDAIDRGLFTSLHHQCYRKVEPGYHTLVGKTVQPATFVHENEVLIYGIKEEDNERCPVVGDKFATLSGQKGVINAILPNSELPRTADGRIPDIFMNPHSFLDRLTIGLHVEGLLAKLSHHLGHAIDVTAFQSGWNLPRAREALEAHGLHGYEELFTEQGKYYGKIFCAPIFFQRLQHMAAPKCNARYEGDMDHRTM
ncbi:hypothetical protein Pcinc_034988 [Petrolisthes cinctipes]|uniref:DNA-directed RNA polymerase n=1 Tax=Petrolisthes cinctipes TaxID=88211 RepID=A0AAE1C1H7_PETCI|nr:hypothetical protein Pcinc_034988 [Petrolisthes cinctipes]